MNLLDEYEAHRQLLIKAQAEMDETIRKIIETLPHKVGKVSTFRDWRGKNVQLRVTSVRLMDRPFLFEIPRWRIEGLRMKADGTTGKRSDGFFYEGVA